MTKQHIEAKPCSTKQLAKLYCIDERTFNKWIEPHSHEIGEKVGNFYNIVQVEIIFKRLGIPEGLKTKT